MMVHNRTLVLYVGIPARLVPLSCTPGSQHVWCPGLYVGIPARLVPGSPNQNMSRFPSKNNIIVKGIRAFLSVRCEGFVIIVLFICCDYGCVPQVCVFTAKGFKCPYVHRQSLDLTWVVRPMVCMGLNILAWHPLRLLQVPHQLPLPGIAQRGGRCRRAAQGQSFGVSYSTFSKFVNFQIHSNV